MVNNSCLLATGSWLKLGGWSKPILFSCSFDKLANWICRDWLIEIMASERMYSLERSSRRAKLNSLEKSSGRVCFGFSFSSSFSLSESWPSSSTLLAELGSAFFLSWTAAESTKFSFFSSSSLLWAENFSFCEEIMVNIGWAKSLFTFCQIEGLSSNFLSSLSKTWVELVFAAKPMRLKKSLPSLANSCLWLGSRNLASKILLCSKKAIRSLKNRFSSRIFFCWSFNSAMILSFWLWAISLSFNRSAMNFSWLSILLTLASLKVWPLKPWIKKGQLKLLPNFCGRSWLKKLPQNSIIACISSRLRLFWLASLLSSRRKLSTLPWSVMVLL